MIPPETLHIDFETRSAADLRRTGHHRYAEDKSTDILCLGWAFDDEAPTVAARASDRVLDHVKAGGKLIAHNAQFELSIWNLCCTKKYGWPKLAIEQIDCTMARAYAMALPGSLEKLAAALGLDMQKDMKGHRLMMKLSQPRDVDALGRVTWWEDEEDLKRLFAYCVQDIEVERAVDRRLLSLTKDERRIWILDQTINNRGITIDGETAKKALDLVALEKEKYDLEIRRVTKNAVATHNANAQLKAWIEERGFATPGVAKNDVLNLLAQVLPPDIRHALEIRQAASKTSTAKLKSMLDGVSLDGRLRGILQYHGAGTGRWAGRKVQPQNLPRPKLKQKDIEDVLIRLRLSSVQHASEFLSLFYGEPMDVVKDCLRGFLCSAPYRTLVALDFTAIEARVLAWLAGQETILEIFRTHGLIYEDQAARIYGVPMELVDTLMRLIGKVATLALGFQGGVGAFQQMAKGYGIQMAPALPGLRKSAKPELLKKALDRWSSLKAKDKVGISEEEWLASELTKLAWRDTNPNIVRFWYDIEAAAMAAVRHPGEKISCRSVTYLKKGSFLFCRLPSGRTLCYPYPKLEEKETPWGAKKETLTYMGEDSTTRKWVRQKAYGGLLVENITQAVARDLLAGAMVRAEERGFPVVLHVHDELVCELSSQVDLPAKYEELKSLVEEVPAWAGGLPLKAEGWYGERYRK